MINKTNIYTKTTNKSTSKTINKKANNVLHTEKNNKLPINNVEPINKNTNINEISQLNNSLKKLNITPIKTPAKIIPAKTPIKTPAKIIKNNTIKNNTEKIKKNDPINFGILSIKNMDNNILEDYLTLYSDDELRSIIKLICVGKKITKLQYIEIYLPNMRILNCEDNLLTSFSMFEKIKLPSLEKLNVKNNLLTSLEDLSAEKLKSINLHNNRFSKLDILPDNFKYLRYLDLSNNILVDISTEIIAPNLEYLDLSGNLLKSLLLDNINLPRLQTLICSRGKLNHVEINLCITKFVCADNELTDLNTIKLPNIQFMDLRNNKLKTFSGIYNTLCEVDISGNAIILVDIRAANLRKMDCSRNKIGKIKLSADNLEYLDCSENYLTNLFSISAEKLHFINISQNYNFNFIENILDITSNNYNNIPNNILNNIPNNILNDNYYDIDDDNSSTISDSSYETATESIEFSNMNYASYTNINSANMTAENMSSAKMTAENIHTKTFAQLFPQIGEIIMDYSQLKYFDCDFYKIPRNLIERYYSTDLDISKNIIMLNIDQYR